jgi:uncharacterized membrane-anchored protein YjiN (DUF445 family)
MSDTFNFKIFGKKTFSNLLEEIYENSVKKEKRMKELISELSPLITTPQSATIVVPLIKEYLEISVKNDEHLIKMAAIVQRVVSNKGGQLTDDVSSLFSEDELKQLQKISEDINKSEYKK